MVDREIIDTENEIDVELNWDELDLDDPYLWSC